MICTRFSCERRTGAPSQSLIKKLLQEVCDTAVDDSWAAISGPRTTRMRAGEDATSGCQPVEGVTALDDAGTAAIIGWGGRTTSAR